MSWAILIIVTVLLVLGLGLLILRLIRRSPNVVPGAVDGPAEHRDQVVAVDDLGRAVMASQEGAVAAPHDDAGFEDVLGDQLKDLRH